MNYNLPYKQNVAETFPICYYCCCSIDDYSIQYWTRTQQRNHKTSRRNKCCNIQFFVGLKTKNKINKQKKIMKTETKE